MLIAVTSTGDSLDSPVDPRFGRCPYYIIVETDDGSFTALPNSSAALGGGAGIEAARAVSDSGAKAVLTGSCGPNAHATLTAAGIEVHDGASGTVRQAVDLFVQGKSAANAQPSAPPHAGMTGSGGGRGMGGGQGAGMGGGQGTGGGRGMGGGRGRGTGPRDGRGGGRGGGGRGGGSGQGR